MCVGNINEYKETSENVKRERYSASLSFISRLMLFINKLGEEISSFFLFQFILINENTMKIRKLFTSPSSTATIDVSISISFHFFALLATMYMFEEKRAKKDLKDLEGGREGRKTPTEGLRMLHLGGMKKGDLIVESHAQSLMRRSKRTPEIAFNWRVVDFFPKQKATMQLHWRIIHTQSRLHPPMLMCTVIVEMHLLEWESMIEHLRTMRRHAMSFIGRGDLYKTVGDIRKAMKEYERCLDVVDSNHFDAKKRLEEGLFLLSEEEEELEDILRFREISFN
jgi:hypothetical protein